MRLAGGTALLDAFQRADVPAQILSLWSEATPPDTADLAYIHDAYAEIVEATESGDFASLTLTVRRLLGFYDCLYRRSFCRQNSI